MGLNILSFTKEEALGYTARNKRANQVYMKKFDVEVVFRKGKLDNSLIDKVRYR